MDIYLKVLKYIVVFCFITCDSDTTGSKLGDYDQLVLTQRSPVAKFFEEEFNWGIDIKKANKQANKELVQIGYFTAREWIIHELWATKDFEGIVADCMYFKGKLLQYRTWTPNAIFESRLKKAWPSFEEKRTDADRWKKHYNIYGCCIQPTPEDFFQDAMNLLNKGNIGDILANSGIVPGKFYDLDMIINSIEKHFRAIPYVKCLIDTSPDADEQFLMEVQICFNKQHQLKDCNFPVFSNAIHFCVDGKSVFYPGL